MAVIPAKAYLNMESALTSGLRNGTAYPPMKVDMKMGHQIMYSLIMPFERSGMSGYQLKTWWRKREVRTERSGIVIESGDCGLGLHLLERNAIL